VYESIQGKLKEKSPNIAVIECGGIGYRLSIPLNTYLRLPALESSMTLYLSLIVREDAHTLYAFFLKEERDLFEVLLTISGIGPKTAAGIIGHMEINAFRQAITTNDTRLLSKVPGIGKKSAERLVMEMRDKFKGKNKLQTSPMVSQGSGIVSDAINALINLGYNALDASQAVQTAASTNKEETDLGRLITAALHQM
jgi:Holliday junction DNA helicase RuvA